MGDDIEAEKKVKIRPRGLAKEKEDSKPEPSEDEELPEKELSRIEQLRKNMLKQTGAKFPARNSMQDPKPAPPEESAKDPAPGAHAPELGSDVESKVQEPAQEVTPVPSPLTEKPQRKRVGFWSRRVRLGAATLTTLIVALVAAGLSIWLGRWWGSEESKVIASRERVEIRPEFEGRLDAALKLLRSGDSEKAGQILAELQEANPDVGSLKYLQAIAAMQNGDIDLAEKKSSESIADWERISDSLAIKAVLATQKAGDSRFKTMGDPRVRSEQLLRQAMVADVANPYPMIELAALLRYQKKNDEARALLEGARSRLNPVDSHTVVDVSLALLNLDQLPNEKLPTQLNAQGDIASTFSAAYVALRRGDSPKAVEALKLAKGRLAPDLFYYLVNDPAFRRYAAEPQVKPFFE